MHLPSAKALRCAALRCLLSIVISIVISVVISIMILLMLMVMLMLLLMLTLMLTLILTLMLMLIYHACCNLRWWTSILKSVSNSRHCRFDLAAAESSKGCSNREALKP